MNYLKQIDKKKILSALLPIFTLMYLEIVLHLLIYKSFGVRTLIPILFSVPAGLVIYFISTCFKPRTNKIIYYIIISVFTLYFVVQYVYYSIFGSFLSLFQVTMGAAAVTNFFDQLMYGLGRVIVFILFFLVPLALTIFLSRKKMIAFERPVLKSKLISIPIILLTHLLCLVCLTFGGTSAYSSYDIYFDKGIGTDITVENLGVLTTTRLEFTNMIFPGLYSKGSLVIIGVNSDPDDEQTEPPVTETEPVDTKSPDTEPAPELVPEPDPTPLTHNMLDIDFEDMIKYETDLDIITLHKYVMNKEPTAKNAYTGVFSGYNLITICAESFSPKLISPTLTPTLYKMSTNGFVFNNYFGSFESNTTNGEYSLCMGLFPDLSRDKIDNSFKASIKNYLPFTMGNVFTRQLGVTPYAFHDYYGTYYQRNLTHPNMGYEFMAPDSGLDMDVYWPSSDYEMMEASIDEYLTTDAPFHAYYMTFSGHYQYNWMNPMSVRNKDSVLGLGYTSETVMSYISCNLELEKALTYLVDRLTQAGVMDRTVIVLTNDHYPYGLSEEEYNELAGEEVDTQFGKYRNSFICWSPSIAQPVVVDEPCCTIDILPTLLNLFGFTYDSRLLCGVDVLSDADHIAIISNQSFITDELTFSSSSNTVASIDPLAELDGDLVQSYKNYVKNIFTVSTAILNKNYYAKFDYLFGDDVDPTVTYPPDTTSALPGADDTAQAVPDTGTQHLTDPVQ